MALKRTTPATLLPVTEAEAAKQCSIDHHDDDLYLRSLIHAAVKHAERVGRRALLTSTWLLGLDRFPCGHAPIILPQPPTQSIEELRYTDADGVEQTIDDFQLDTISEPARLFPAYGECWPCTRDVPNAVQVEFLAGYTSAAFVPATTKLGILQLIAHWYEHREAVTDGEVMSEVPQTIDILLTDDRVYRFL